ncbi:uncharacterized protein C8A04DRAFT_35062 [Dichotomopilus funicola]|uniref:Uncharacterized protein n=1 Tax=Dichotomopilus funicola TaxID=1934379 RepID=A0AAN6ZQJ2_9PEZI|nr:hypothetical protein C8A04DRAFT_35062 [Dichotomopilus funicola]
MRGDGHSTSGNNNDSDSDDRGSNNSSSISNSDTTNPFIRFRHHVDANIHSGLTTLLATARREPSSAVPGSRPENPSSFPSSNTTPTNISSTPNLSSSNMDKPTPTSISTPTLTPAQTHLESRLDVLRAGTPAEARLGWHLFLTRSAYSPLVLERDGTLPGPGFRGRSTGGRGRGRVGWEGEDGDDQKVVDGEGWLEAFEDLMRVESGLGLREIPSSKRDRTVDGFGAFGVFGSGGSGIWDLSHHSGIHNNPWLTRQELREAAWLNRMQSHGLTEVLFPVYDPGLGYASPRTAAEWAERRRTEQQYRVQQQERQEREEREAEQAWEELVGAGRRVVEEARREAEREAEAWTEDAKKGVRREVDAWRDFANEKGASLFDGIGGVVRMLGRVLEDEVKALEKFGKGDGHDRGKTEEGQQQRQDRATEKKAKVEPETENDLYSAVESAFHQSERSLSNFFKSIAEGQRSSNPTTINSNNNNNNNNNQRPNPDSSTPTVSTTETVEDGLTKKTTTEKFVDSRGNTHSQTETTWTDEHGNVVMKQVHSTVGRSERWGQRLEDGSSGGGVETDEKKNATGEHGGQQQQQQRQQQNKDGGWFWK